jgi:hypothetical protein
MCDVIDDSSAREYREVAAGTMRSDMGPAALADVLAVWIVMTSIRGTTRDALPLMALRWKAVQ